MLKMAPVALLRCGTVHPGHYLALVGGSVAATAEAHAAGLAKTGLHERALMIDRWSRLIFPSVFVAVLFLSLAR